MRCVIKVFLVILKPENDPRESAVEIISPMASMTSKNSSGESEKPCFDPRDALKMQEDTPLTNTMNFAVVMQAIIH